MAQLKHTNMATAAETFYSQDYLDLNPDVAASSYKTNPKRHWDDHGVREIVDGVYGRRWNKQVPDRQSKPPIVFLTGSSSPIVEPVKKAIKSVTITFSDGTTQTTD